MMAHAADAYPPPIMREFESPSGRRWTARLFYFPKAGSASPREGRPATSGSVLRFASDDVTLDLADWPGDWLLASDAELLALLRRASPPTFPPPGRLTPPYTQAKQPGGKPSSR